MHPQSIPVYLLPFLATTSLAINHPIPRAVNGELVEIATAAYPETTPAPQMIHLDLQQDTAPHLKHLDLRQNAVPAPVQPAAQPAAAPAAGAQAPAVPAPAVPAPVAPAPAAPVAGVGGGGAPAAQPAPGAAANPVTMVLVNTVIGGVTTQVSVAFTQSFGAAASAPAVQSGSIGLGTLTGAVGVVKTSSAKSDAVRPTAAERGRLLWETLTLTMVVGVMGIGGGVWGLGLL